MLPDSTSSTPNTAIEILRAGKALPAVTLTDDEATVVLAAFGLKVDLRLARASGTRSVALGLTLTIAAAVAAGGGGAVAATFFLGPVVGAAVGLILAGVGAAAAGRAVGFRVSLKFLPADRVELAAAVTE